MTLSSKSALQEPALEGRLLFRVTLAACLLFWIFVFGDSGWGPNLTPLSNQLHAPLSITGLFYVVWSTGYLPGALVGGAMLDRYGPRRVLFVAALIILCGMLLIVLGVSAVNWGPTPLCFDNGPAGHCRTGGNRGRCNRCHNEWTDKRGGCAETWRGAQPVQSTVPPWRCVHRPHRCGTALLVYLRPSPALPLHHLFHLCRH